MPSAYLELLQEIVENTTNTTVTSPLRSIDTSAFYTPQEESVIAEEQHKTKVPWYEEHYVFDELMPMYVSESNWWERCTAKRKTHFYSRPVRFRSYLYHIIGSLGTTPDIPIAQIIGDVRLTKQLRNNPAQSYEIVYAYLRERKKRKSYISIPWIINCLGGPRWKVPFHVLERIESNFLILHLNFNDMKSEVGRKRFPKLQYIVLKMLHDEGITFPYHMPLTRTYKRQLGLDPIYTKINVDLPVYGDAIQK